MSTTRGGSVCLKSMCIQNMGVYRRSWRAGLHLSTWFYMMPRALLGVADTLLMSFEDTDAGNFFLLTHQKAQLQTISSSSKNK